MKKFLLISSLALVGPIAGSVVACSSNIDNEGNEGTIKIKNPIVDQVTDSANELISFLNKGLINSGNGGTNNVAVNDSEYQIKQFIKEKGMSKLKAKVIRIRTENNQKHRMAVTFSTDTETYQPIEFFWYQPVMPTK